MTKRYLSIAAALLLTLSAAAVPAKRIKQQVKQPDGTTLTIMMRGDENFHFLCTEDGNPVVKDTDGAYRYATLTVDGDIVASKQMAHDASQRNNAETAFLSNYSNEASAVRSLGKKKAAARNASRMARMAKRGTIDKNGYIKPKGITAGAWGGEGIGITGKRKGLVILVNFKDKTMNSKHTQEEWNNFFNQEGYSNNKNSGSVHDYFKSQSYGLFDLEFDVVGPVTVSKNMAEYGANDRNGNDKDPAGMAYEACRLASPFVNYADYDWDGDGEVDQVFIIYAGYGEASAYNKYPDTIWQHEWELQAGGYNLTLDGVRINTYGCSSELYGDSGSTMDGIGTACHEFSHCLGLPDLYDVDYSGGFGMSDWDLMDAGSYAGDGYRPVGYNSYEKWVSGWLQPTELNKACMVNGMKPLSEEPEAYIIYNEKTPTEYYLLENRQMSNTDKEIPANGMLVLHVDYDKTVWENNAVNDTPGKQRLTIVPADNILTDKTVDGDTYPGKSKNTELTDTSTPAARLNNKNSDGRFYLGKPITDIAENNRLISFAFMGGKSVDTPEETTTAGVTENSFTANWTAVENAESYNLELREKPQKATAEESMKLKEDLTTWGVDFKGDGTTDISAELDEKMQNPGWTGLKVFECNRMAKLGSSKVKGYLASPLITTPATTAVTVRLTSKPYNSDSEVNVTLIDASGNEISTTSFECNGSTATISLENIKGEDFKVKIHPKKRCYVEDIAIYDGAFDETDFADAANAPKPLLAAAANGTQQFSGITETTYAFNDLTPNTVYQWRVQAVSEGIVSKWTAWHEIETSGTNCIKNITDVYSGNAEMEVFTAAGTYVGKMTYSRFMQSPLAGGIYMLKNGENAVRIMK